MLPAPHFKHIKVRLIRDMIGKYSAILAQQIESQTGPLMDNFVNLSSLIPDGAMVQLTCCPAQTSSELPQEIVDKFRKSDTCRSYSNIKCNECFSRRWWGIQHFGLKKKGEIDASYICNSLELAAYNSGRECQRSYSDNMRKAVGNALFQAPPLETHTLLVEM